MTSFQKDQYQTLFAYHWHTNRKLMERAMKLEEADTKANPGYGRGSIHNLLFHILRTDRSWRAGMESGQQVHGLDPEDYPDLASIQAGLEAEERAWQELLEKLGEEEIEGCIDLTDRRGRSYSIPRWRILQHLMLHGMQHHSELAQLLTQQGESPGDIDFIFYAE